VLAPGGRLVMATWEGSDPRWAWEREVRMPFAAKIDPSRLQELLGGLTMLARFDTAEKVEQELSTAGFDAETVDTHAIDFTFGSEDDWWELNWSHGARVFLEALPEEDRSEFRRAAYERMQQNREGDGFPRRYTALFSRSV